MTELFNYFAKEVIEDMYVQPEFWAREIEEFDVIFLHKTKGWGNIVEFTYPNDIHLKVKFIYDDGTIDRAEFDLGEIKFDIDKFAFSQETYARSMGLKVRRIDEYDENRFDSENFNHPDFIYSTIMNRYPSFSDEELQAHYSLCNVEKGLGYCVVCDEIMSLKKMHRHYISKHPADYKFWKDFPIYIFFLKKEPKAICPICKSKLNPRNKNKHFKKVHPGEEVPENILLEKPEIQWCIKEIDEQKIMRSKSKKDLMDHVILVPKVK